MKKAIMTFSNGEDVAIEMPGTEDQIKRYLLGNWFTLADGLPYQCVAIQFG